MNGGDGFDTIRAMRDGAEEVPASRGEDQGPVDGPPPDDGPARDAAEFLPEGCPVVPLGVSGDLCFYLDQLGQLRDLKAKDHSRLNVMSLFGRRAGLLYDYWPRKSQDKESKEWFVTGWMPERGAEALMAAAATKGPWSPFERVRGPGAWLGKDGELVLHVGDRLLVVPAEKPKPGAPPWKEMAPGEIGGYVYPTAPPTLRPAIDAQPDGPDGPAQKMLDIFKTWNLKRPDLDPQLLLGWNGASRLGGAISWRALLWATGGFGTGKSSLLEHMHWSLGDGGILHTSDPTAAGVRQILRHASLPVALDEMEAEEDNRRMNQMVKLARDAATGALAIRGSSDHQAATFTVRSCFVFSSILIPPLLPQDRSRMAVVEVGKLSPDAPPLKTTPKQMAELGSQLLRRLVDQWWRWPETATKYREMLRGAGHSARGQDVFGTMLAAADLLLYDELPDQGDLDAWAEKLPAATMAETAGADDDSTSCLMHLLTTTIDSPHDRQRGAVGWWVARAAGIDPDGPGIAMAPDQAKYANRVLAASAGVKVHMYDLEDGNGPKPWLAVPNSHNKLAQIFDNSQWGGRPGADGVWKQSLGRLAPDPRQINVQVWIGGNVRSTLVPLDLCLPSGDSPTSKDPSAAGRSPAPKGAGNGTADPANGRPSADTASSNPDEPPF